MDNNDLRPLVEEFFKGIGATVNSDSVSSDITSVPKDFENSYGKAGPYSFNYDPSIISGKSFTELVTKGSLILQKISDYLEKKGSTSCVRIIFPDDYLGAFKRHLRLRNAEIVGFTTKENYDFVYRFTFQTLLQYLNEKEQVVNQLFIKNGEVVNFLLDNYKSEPFEIAADPTMSKNNYDSAKKHLKELVSSRIDQTSVLLTDKLAKEEARIKEHYSKQRAEYEVSITRLQAQANDLEKQQSKAKPGDLLTISQKILKVKKSIDELKNSDYLKNLTHEESFFLLEESQKHGLNVNNKLLSTTLIACPLYTFTLQIKSKDKTKFVDKNYDPFTQKLSPPFKCDSCERETVELSLCNSSHLSCVNCSWNCSDCYSPMCKKCSTKNCDYCAKKLCGKCFSYCNICKSGVCKNHSREDFSNGKSGCTRCLKQCIICKKHTSTSNLAKNDGFNIVCKACDRLSFLKE
ncbi:MAG: hypothetical protein AABW73_03260 [Nanoarchaeota archaeon]